MRTHVAAFALVALAACGSDPDPGTVNPQSARTSIDQVGNVNVAMMNSNGSAAASAVAAMTAAGQGIVSPAAPGARLGLAPSELPDSQILAAQTGTAECTPTGCTFTNFGDDTPGNAWTIDGTITKSGDTITFDLSYDIASQGAQVDWNIEGSVTVTPTSLDGAVHSTGSSSTAGTSVDWDVNVRYDDVVLDGTGCPTGGSVTASTSYSVMGQGYDVEGTVTFGPACGETH